MLKSEDEPEKYRFYNAERILAQFSKAFPRAGPFRRAIRTTTRPLGDFSGLFISFAVLPILFIFPILVLGGLVYGVWVFLLGASLVIGGTGYVVHRKVGKSLQFENTNFLRKLLALSVAFALTLGLFGIIIFLAKLLA